MFPFFHSLDCYTYFTAKTLMYSHCFLYNPLYCARIELQDIIDRDEKGKYQDGDSCLIIIVTL